MHKFIIAALVAVISFTAIPVAVASAKAPNVRCKQLDKAERQIRRAGFRVVEHGGGIFGIIIKADWVVVHQSQRGKTVHLTAGRYC